MQVNEASMKLLEHMLATLRQGLAAVNTWPDISEAAKERRKKKRQLGV